MKYLKKFSTNADYQAFTGGDDYITPNVCYVEETDGVVAKPYTKVLQPSNVIYYTSFTENVLTPFNISAFGANIISNTYNNGKGIITFDNDLTTIGEYAFRDRLNFTSITIPDSVTTIGKSAFMSCARLTNITIPDSVTTIGTWAFSYCYNLTSVYCKATTPPSLGTDVFDSNVSGRKIYVPAESVDAYKVATNWSAYANDIIGYDF